MATRKTLSSGKSATTRKGTTTTGRSKVAKTQAQKDIEDYTLDTVPVITADGEEHILAELDPTPVDDEWDVAQPEPQVQRQAAQKSKSTSSKPKTGAAGQNANVKASREAAQAKREADKALAEAARLKKELAEQKLKVAEEAKARKEAERKAAQEKREAEKKAKAEEREKAAAERREQREKEKAERARMRSLAPGMTGDAEKDAHFTAAVARAEALAVVPANPAFLRIPGVTFTTVGVTLPDDLPVDEWTEITHSLNQAKDMAGFALGDALVFGEARYGKQYDVVTRKLDLALATVKNYKQVAAAWPLDERVPGAGPMAHLYATALYRTDPAAARNLLEEKVAGKHSDAWLREKLAELRGDTATEPRQTQAARRTSVLQALAQMPDEQFEAELATLSPTEQVEYRTADVESLFEQANVDDVVPSAQVRRSVTWLAQRVTELEAELAEWQSRAQAAEARLAELGEAQARVAGHADPLAFIEGEYAEAGDEEPSTSDLEAIENGDEAEDDM